MGKGYGNFMSKKAFHPGSHANQKKIHEAEAKAEAKRKHDEETLAQYQKEQELFNQKSLVSKQSREKLSLNFMYEAPPGVKKPEEKKGDSVEWKSSKGNSTSVKVGEVSRGEPTICLEWKREKPAKRQMPRSKNESTNKSTTQDTKRIKKEQ